MSESVKGFPSSSTEALAYLYIKQQDLHGKTPAEIHTMYQDAYYEILKDHRKKYDSKWFIKKNEEIRQP